MTIALGDFVDAVLCGCSGGAAAGRWLRAVPHPRACRRLRCNMWTTQTWAGPGWGWFIMVARSEVRLASSSLLTRPTSTRIDRGGVRGAHVHCRRGGGCGWRSPGGGPSMGDCFGSARTSVAAVIEIRPKKFSARGWEFFPSGSRRTVDELQTVLRGRATQWWCGEVAPLRSSQIALGGGASCERLQCRAAGCGASRYMRGRIAVAQHVVQGGCTGAYSRPRF